MYDVNKQCELMFGLGSQVCPYLVSEQHSHAQSILKNYWKVGLEMKSQDLWFWKNFILKYVKIQVLCCWRGKSSVESIAPLYA